MSRACSQKHGVIYNFWYIKKCHYFHIFFGENFISIAYSVGKYVCIFKEMFISIIYDITETQVPFLYFFVILTLLQGALQWFKICDLNLLKMSRSIYRNSSRFSLVSHFKVKLAFQFPADNNKGCFQ